MRRNEGKGKNKGKSKAKAKADCPRDEGLQQKKQKQIPSG
jgi:hypothetical protein